jgi:hypothetical protein
MHLIIVGAAYTQIVVSDCWSWWSFWRNESDPHIQASEEIRHTHTLCFWKLLNERERRKKIEFVAISFIRYENTKWLQLIYIGCYLQHK